MRHKQVAEQKPGIRKAQSKEPLAETIQKKRRPRDFFTKMSDTELISYAKTYVEENKIKNRKGLAKADSGLSGVLRIRKLLDTVIPEKQEKRNWSSMSDDVIIQYANGFIKENDIKTIRALRKRYSSFYEVLRKRKIISLIFTEKRICRDWASMPDKHLISYTKKFVDQNAIKNRSSLEKAEPGLYKALVKRNLLDSVVSRIRKERRNWSSMSDEELVKFAKNFIKENEIKNRKSLKKADNGLHEVLRKRNLLYTIVSRELRNWSSMSDEELVKFAKNFIKEKGIRGRFDLEKADAGMYHILRERKLLYRIISSKLRNWISMGDSMLISLAKEFMQENGIKNRKSLQKADCSMYEILRKRNLIDAVIPEKQYRDWSSIPDDELISYVKTYIEENGIENRSGLAKKDVGLYNVLRKRNLIDVVIPKKRETRDRRNWSSMLDEELISFARKFMEEKRIKNRSSLQKADAGLYHVLRKRNLIDIVIPEKQEQRDWASKPDEELISYAKKFIKENTIKTRSGLAKADSGLHNILRKRNLLSAVFSDIEQAKKTEAVKQVVDAMKEFGGSE